MRTPHAILHTLICSSFLLLPMSARALTVLPGFNPSILIPDTVFNDVSTFGGPDGVQRFLESKGSVLANTAPDFISRLNEPESPMLKEALSDPHPNLGRLRTAAELIWDAAQASGMNPQVILITLQKEQGLIINSNNQSWSQRALNHAMGFDCPDASGCGNLFPGFYFQLFGNVDTEGNRYMGAPKSLMRSYSMPNGRGPSVNGIPARVGETISIQNTLGDYDGIAGRQDVTIGNRATAALYRYTPHVFNGNYNFWKFFITWFKYPNGTLIRSAQDGLTYIIQNGSRQLVPTFVATARKLNLQSALTLSLMEMDSYPPGSAYGPPEDTVANVEGKTYVFLDGTLHPASDFVLAQRKMATTTRLAVTASDANLFQLGSQLTPSEGTVLRGKKQPDVYLVEKGILKRYSEFTFKQYGVQKQMQMIPDDEVASYQKDGFVIPKEGTLVSAPSNGGTYLVRDQRRLPITAELFKNLGFKQKDVVKLTSDAEFASIPIGPPAPPKEGTYFAISGSKELYVYKGGTKHLIFPYIAKQRGITPDFFFDASFVSAWPDGIAVTPVDNTLVKGEGSADLFLVQNGQLHPLTPNLIKNLSLNTKKAVTLSDAEMNVLPKGSYAEPAEGTFFTVLGTNQLFIFKNGTKRPIFPFVATQRGITSDFTFNQDATDDWDVGTPVAPRDGTLLKAKSGTTIYLVSLSKLRPLSTKAFKRKGYKLKNVISIPKSELDAFPVGDAILK